MTEERRRLPSRRRAVTFKFAHEALGGGLIKLHVTVGLHPDGAPGELFINTHKTGNETNTLLTDAAVAISLAIQYGCPLSVLRKAMKRNPDGTAMGLFSHLLDKVAELTEEGEGG